MAWIAGLLENSSTIQPTASSTRKMIRIGLCSSHSPGRVGLVTGCASALMSTWQAAASLALAAPGAVT